MVRARLCLVAATLWLGGALLAWSDEPPAGPLADWISGTVAHYTLTPKGDVDGFVLTDGTQVHVAPHLGASLVYMARPGDQVAVQGDRTGAGSLVEASEVRNSGSGVQFVNEGPERETLTPQTEMIEGKVAFILHGPKGDLNGAILEDGTVLRLPPHLGKGLAPGRSVTAQGRTQAMAKVVEVEKLTAAPDGM